MNRCSITAIFTVNDNKNMTLKGNEKNINEEANKQKQINSIFENKPKKENRLKTF